MKKVYPYLLLLLLIIIGFSSQSFFTSEFEIDETCQYSLNDTIKHPTLKERLRLSKETRKLNSSGNEKTDGIETVDGLEIEDLVRDVFIGGNCFDVSGISGPGGEGAYGEFYSGSSSINIEEGIILSTGVINIAHGPNLQTGASSSTGTAGIDPDLAQLIGISNLHDVAIIEFDFIPNDDSISFDYVFASEEYCDYVNSQFNDVFGFFLSGPGINGPFSNNGINIATVPQTSDFVAINNVNWGSNNTFYVDNVPVGQGQGAGGCVPGELNNPPAAENEIEFDGYTTVLTASAAVTACETYHIKLAIADVSDGLFDSAVFLKGNSFAAGSGADVEIGYPDPRFDVAFEGCSNGYFYFERVGNSNINEPLTINFTLLPSSTATPDEDYEGFPNSFTIPAGQIGDTLWMNVFSDLIIEGQETVIIELDNTCSCFDPIFELIIDEPEELDVGLESYEFCNPEGLFLRPEVIGGIPPYNYVWEDGTTDEERFVAPMESTTYYLTITDQCDAEMIDSSVFIIFEELEATIDGDIKLCTSNPMDTGYLEINFLTGGGPWGIVYTHNGTPTSLFDITENPFYLPVTEPGVYELISVFQEDCFGQGEGLGTVEIVDISLDLQTEALNCWSATEGEIELTVTGGSGDLVFDWDNADDVEDPDNLAPGVYSVTVTDTLSCFATGSIEIESPPPLQLTSDVGTVNCTNPTEGYIDLEVVGGAGNISYLWDSGEQTQDIDNLGAGTYIVSATDENDCEHVFEFEIIGDFVEPIIDINTLDVVTCDLAQATISGLGSDEGPDYTILWTTIDGNIVSDPSQIEIIVDEIGTYQLTITNLLNGCSSTRDIYIDVFVTSPTAIATVDDVINCYNPVITVEGSVVEPGNISYEWSTIDGSIVGDPNTANPNIDAPGEYFLTVTDNVTGCTDETSVVVAQNIDKPTAGVGPDVLLTCSEVQFSLDGSSSSGNNISYEWTTIDGNIVFGANSPDPIIDAPGEYVLIVTDPTSGCKDTASVIADEDITPPIVVLAQPDILSCMLDSVILNSSGSSTGNNFSYLWSSADGHPISDIAAPNPTVTNAGTYTLTILNQDNDCIESLDINVGSNYSTPVASAGPSIEIACTDTTVTLQGANLSNGSTYSYLWTTEDGDIAGGENSLSINVTVSGTYTLLITDLESGCIDSDDADVLLDAGFPVSSIAEPPSLNCELTELQIDASASTSGGPFQLQWSTIGGNIVSGGNTLMPTVDAAGIYSLLVTNVENDCLAESAVIVRIDTTTPQVSIAPVGEINCDFSSQMINADIITGSGVYTVEWVTLDGEIASSPDQASIEVTRGGTYEITVIDSTNRCLATASVYVPEDADIPFVTLGPDESINCVRPTVSLTGTTNGTGNLIWTWTTPDGNIITDPNLPTIEVDQAGTYELSIVNIDNNCGHSNSVLVDENFTMPDPMLNEPDTLTCNVDVVDIILSNVPNTAEYDISWTGPDGSPILPGDPYLLNVSIGGNYTVDVMNMVSGCVNTNSVEVPEIINPITEIEVLVTPPPCDAEFGTIEVYAVEGGTGPYEYSVDGGTTFESNDIFDDLQPGRYSVIISDVYGCEYEEIVDIPEWEPIDINLIDIISIDFSEDYEMELELNISLDLIDSIIWTPDELLSCNNCPNPVANPFNNITYHVRVIDANGCEDEAQIRILVDNEPEIYIPNIFTPFNKDYTNDWFFINAKEGQVRNVLEFLIFDRWGNRVFENFDFQPNEPLEGWNGTYRNKEVNPAVFAYMAKIQLIDDRIIIMHGDVTVLD